MRWGLPFLVVIAACKKAEDPLTFDELLDPAVCADCHPDHHREWSGSMHAYASTDPLFLAMNAQGQAQTGGELGDFCVGCHAPLAVELGLTEDGLNLEELPAEVQGVTCTFCHQVDDLGTQGHNNPLGIARDSVMRGPFREAVDPGVHKTAYSPLHDREAPESADMCGRCHDIVTPLGAHIERTYAEWQASLYADSTSVFGLTCGECHMRGRDGVAAEFEGVDLRRVHSHTFAGVDVALTEFPERDAQREEIQRLLDTSLLATLCATPGPDPRILVQIENVASGHMFPSGAAADRRTWMELVAYQGGQEVWSTGVVADGEPAVDVFDDHTWTFIDTLLDSNGEPTHKFWEAADYRTALLPPPTSADPNDPDYITTHINREWSLPGVSADRITMRVRIRPFGLDIVDEMSSEGFLDASIGQAIPTFDLASTRLEWTAALPVGEDGFACTPGPPKPL